MRHFPLFISFAQGLVDLCTQRFQCLLPAFVDLVDLFVIGDGFERDVRHALVNKAVPQISAKIGFASAQDSVLRRGVQLVLFLIAFG